MRLPLTSILILALGLAASRAYSAPLRYNGPGNGLDEAYAITADAGGNVYVTGTSKAANQDILTIKYNAAGAPAWTARYNGPGNGSDSAKAIAVDGAGNVFVTGYATGAAGNYDFATLKYNAVGALLWARLYNGIGNGNDYAVGLALDGAGDVFVTGRAPGIAGTNDFVTLKYSPTGGQMWVALYTGLGGADDPRAIAADTIGNSYVTGRSQSLAGDFDYATIKYSPVGALIWQRRYNGPGNDYDGAEALCLDGLGRVCVTGGSKGIGTAQDIATVQYSAANGAELSICRYNGPDNLNDNGLVVKADGAGNFHVAGNSVNAASSRSDLVTIKYTAAGALIWQRRYNGPAGLQDEGRALVLDPAGNVYVAGPSAGVGTSGDYVTLKYSSVGALIWQRVYDASGDMDTAWALTRDSAGNICVTGGSTGVGTGNDYATRKYTPAGAIVW